MNQEPNNNENGITQVPVTPATPVMPEVQTQVPVTPETPVMPEAQTQVPVTPVNPVMPEAQIQVPVTPVMTEAQTQVPVTPVNPVMPETQTQVPVTPVNPVMPETQTQVPVTPVNPVMPETQNQMNTKKFDFKSFIIKYKLFIIIGIAVLIAVIVGIVLINNNKKNTISDAYVDWEKEQEKETKSILDKVEYKIESKFSNGDILISLTSKYEDFVTVAIPFKFYDKDQIQLDTEDVYFNCVESNSTLYMVVGAPDDYETYKIDEEGIDAYISTDGIYKCVNYTNKYSSNLTYNSEDEKYNLLFTNNTDSSVNVSGYVLYYKGESPFDADSVYISSVDAKSSAKKDAYLPYDSEFNKVIPDNAKFVLSSITKSS